MPPSHSHTLSFYIPLAALCRHQDETQQHLQSGHAHNAATAAAANGKQHRHQRTMSLAARCARSADELHLCLQSGTRAERAV